MKQFFKFLFASMFGFIIGSIVLFFLFLLIMTSLVNSVGKQEVSIKPGTVLQISFNQPLHDRSPNNPLAQIDFGSFKSKMQLGLDDIIKNINKASADNNIKGIYLDISSLQSGFASVEEIRNALLEFKKSGKFIYAYADGYTQGAYYLATVADKIYLNPQGAITLNGLSTQLMFFKGTLEKLEIEPEVIRHGKFKSAIEPFILDKMSDENRAQVKGFVDPLWNHLVEGVASARKINAATIKQIADSLKAQDADDALRLNLVDHVSYFDEFTADLNAKLGKSSNEKINFITLNKYNKVPQSFKNKPFAKDKIAVIYACGEIEGGQGDDEKIGSDGLSAAIREARLDNKVKAIVMRVNSPGGSALASEVIWREVSLARKVKPFIISMGDVAASGGYYISCAADTIVAQPNTITGSIGVFGLMFNAEKLLKNKLGITTDVYKTSPYTDMGSIARPLTTSEHLMIQHDVDKVYNTFTKRVADGRKMQQSAVDSIGQGRVWSAIDAKRIGLVDVLGGLDDAIKIAAKKAHVDNYRLKVLPEQKEPFQTIMDGLSGDAETFYMKTKLGAEYRYWNAAQDVLKEQGIQSRCWYDVRCD